MMPDMKSGLVVIRKTTGEVVEVDCDDESQLMIAFRGTAKAIDRAVLNIGKSRTDKFLMAAQKKRQELIRQTDFKGSDALVLMMIENTVGYGNKITVAQTTVVRELGLSKSAVSKSFKKLREKKIIIEVSKNDGTAELRLSEEYAIKGKRKLLGSSKLEAVENAKSVLRESGAKNAS